MVFKKICLVICILSLLLPSNTDCKGFSLKNFKSIATIITIVTFLVGVVSFKYIKHWYNMRNLHIKVDGLKKDVGEVKKFVEDVENGIKEVKIDVDGVKKSVETVEGGVKELKTDVGEVKKGVGDVENGVKELKTDVVDVKKSVGDVESSVKELKDDNKGIKEVTVAINTNVVDLQAKVSEFEKKTGKDLSGLLTEFEVVKNNLKNLVEKSDLKDVKESLGIIDEKVGNVKEQVLLNIREAEGRQKEYVKGQFERFDGKNAVSFEQLKQVLLEKVERENNNLRGIISSSIGGLSSSVNKIGMELGEIKNNFMSMQKIASVAQILQKN